MTSTENVTIDAHSEGKHGAVGTVILFLSFTVLLGCLCKLILSQELKNKFPAPFTVILLILGFTMGMIISQIPVMNNDFLLGEKELKDINPHLIYYIFLPLLTFDSAFNSRFYVIRQHIISAILLAGPGALISTGVVGFFSAVVFPYQWSWLMSIMFGSILSATDPVAVVALLHESGASKSLAALIDLESLLNDGSAFVVFMIFRNIIVGESGSMTKILVSTVKFTIGGPVFGMVCGILTVMFYNRVHNQPEVEILSTFGLAYLVFYIADVELGISAVLALVVMGLYIAKHKYCVSSRVQTPMVDTWRTVIGFANILIFIITGILLAHSLVGTKATIVARDFGYSILLYIVLHLSRIVSVIIFYPFIRWSGICFSWKEYVVLIWSGLRGSMSVILALIIKSDDRIDIETRNRYLFHICMMALLTLIINGTSSRFLVKLLDLNHGTSESKQMLLQAFHHMQKLTTKQLCRMREEKQFIDVDWHMLEEYLPEKLVEELDVEQKTSIHRRLCNLSQCNPKFLFDHSQSHLLTNIQLRMPAICETDRTLINIKLQEENPTIKYIILPVLTISTTNFRNELINRFLTALLVDYEKQWYRGMIRRTTLYILIKSVEKAKHHKSLKIHWDLIVQHFHLSKSSQILMQFNGVKCIEKQSSKLLFDHIFLTIELVLAFHSTRTRMNQIQEEFPELANIHRDIWDQICEETHFYHLTASYILLDLRQSYELCWRIHMTKRCAQILLKYESKMITELYETGILSHSVYSNIADLIEQKSLELEFYHVHLCKKHLKFIEDTFDLLPIFQALPSEQKQRWKAILKSKYRLFQPNQVLLEKNQTVSTAYLIVRGIVECDIDSIPIYYRAENMIGIDGLFSRNSVSHGTYFVIGGLSEGFLIDDELLRQFLDNDWFAPFVYREIALHLLSSTYQIYLKLTRLRIRLLLHERAKFYRKTLPTTIQLDENQHFLILAGYVTSLSNNTLSDKHASIEFQNFDRDVEIYLDSSTVAYSWTDDDEQFCINETDHTVHFPLQTKNSLFDNDIICTDYATDKEQMDDSIPSIDV